MSDLAATNCGCNDNNGCGCNSIIWIIILLSLCGNNGSGLFSNNSGCDNNNSCIWIILLLLFCNNGSSGFSFGNSCGCGCGTNFC